MEFEKHKRMLNQELDHFTVMLSEILPRYLELMRKKDISDNENKELGELEHFLIEVNSKIADIKSKLDHDLFGETINEYYKIKEQALQGDVEAKEKLDKLRSTLSDSIKGDLFFNWN
jgi:hypothetical protein